MAGPSLRDRFFTRPVAQAVTSPSGILAAGAGTAVAILAGAPLVAAAGVGALAYGARVALAIPRTPRPDIDPLRLQDPWRTFVWEARQAQRRFEEAAGRARRGPLQDRLASLGERIERAVAECWRVAQAGQALSDARASLDVQGLDRDLDRLLDRGQPEPGSRTAKTVAAVQAQLATAGRLDATIGDAVDRLRLLDARLDEAVARAIELSARAHGADDLHGLDSDVGDLVVELEALRQALDETSTGPVASTVDPSLLASPPPVPDDARPTSGEEPGRPQPGTA